MELSLSSEIKHLLSLTGQVHTEEFPYDVVFTIQAITHTVTTQNVVIGALGRKGTRVVDIAVLPEYRKYGIAKALIDIAKVNTAYVVTKEAEEFWQHIGWYYFYDTKDKGTLVKVYSKSRESSKRSD